MISSVAEDRTGSGTNDSVIGQRLLRFKRTWVVCFYDSNAGVVSPLRSEWKGKKGQRKWRFTRGECMKNTRRSKKKVKEKNDTWMRRVIIHRCSCSFFRTDATRRTPHTSVCKFSKSNFNREIVLEWRLIRDRASPVEQFSCANLSVS